MTFHPVDEAFESRLRADLPGEAFREITPGYLETPRGELRSERALLVAPGTAAEVAAVIRSANDAGVAIVPYSGGTGLAGGQVSPDLDRPVVLSTERMTAVRSVHPEENAIVVEAGLILQDLHDAAEAADRLFPLSLAAKGSARVGGILSTNAGGVRVLRYGNARDLCLGIEAVMPNGDIHHGLTRLRKNNTGYDLRNLLIGAEGTLGIITAAALKLFPRPAAEGTAVFAVESPAAALGVLSASLERLGPNVAAFELISGVGIDFLSEVGPAVKPPLDPAPDWMALIDVGGAAGFDPEAALTDLFEACVEAGLVSDGVIAQSEAQRAAFWEVRESLPEANRRIGSIASHDISLPLSEVPGFITAASERIARLGDFRINGYGHLGDGNLHYNVFPPKGGDRGDYPGMRAEITRAIHDLVAEKGGSFSAEHGIGRLKVADLERYGDPAKLAAMRAIKSAIDPRGIMNPGAVVRVGPRRVAPL